MRPPFRLLLAGFGALLLLGVFVVFIRVGDREQVRIRGRYRQMSAALASGDMNQAMALLAPQCRSAIGPTELIRLRSLLAPLGDHSSILVLGEHATVWPERSSHLIVLPGGNTFEMVRVAGDWFFTGAIHID